MFDKQDILNILIWIGIVVVVVAVNVGIIWLAALIIKAVFFSP